MENTRMGLALAVLARAARAGIYKIAGPDPNMRIVVTSHVIALLADDVGDGLTAAGRAELARFIEAVASDMREAEAENDARAAAHIPVDPMLTEK